MKNEIRYAVNPLDCKSYDTARLRKEFLVGDIFETDCINFVYSYQDRFIVGGAMPVNQSLVPGVPDILKAEYFLERREMGIINVGKPVHRKIPIFEP